jgi:hypothetical protein
MRPPAQTVRRRPITQTRPVASVSRRCRSAAGAGSARPQDRRLPLAREVLEAAGVEQRLLELAPLKLVQLHEWWVADDLLNAAAQLNARPLAEGSRAGYWAGDVAGERPDLE